VCLTFALFDDGQRHALDPNLEEEMAQEGSITFSFNIHRELCTVSKAGGVAISTEKFMQLATIAGSKAHYLTKLMKNALISETTE
jgi:exosome complex component RRP45